jgi:uncharacterized protein (TIGR03437 family)
LSGGTIVADYNATGAGASKRITITPSSSPALRAGTYYIAIVVGTAGTTVSGSILGTMTVPCAYSLSPASASVGASGGTGSVAIATAAGCSWQAASGANWISVSPSSGTGPGTLTWSAAANTASAGRTGTVGVGGQTFTLSQAAAAATTNDLVSGGSIEWTLPAVSTASLLHAEYGYRVTVGASVTQLEIFLAVGTAGATVDLYVRYGSDVAVSNGAVVADYSVKGGGTTRRLVIDRGSSPALRAGVYYIGFVVTSLNVATRGTLVTNAGTATQPPAVTDGGVVGAASFIATGVVPGSPFTIFGDGFAASDAGATAVPLPTSLGGVQVRVNGVLCPLFYAGPKQINAQLPYETPAGEAELVVLVNGMASASARFAVYPVGPGIIQYSAANRLRAVAVNQDGVLNGTTAAAARSSVMTVYLVGAGPVKPGQPLVTGSGTPMELRWLDQPYSVTIGGVAAVVDYIGLTPGAVGLYQMNVRVPQALSPGDYPISLKVGQATSNTPFVAVK